MTVRPLGLEDLPHVSAEAARAVAEAGARAARLPRTLELTAPPFGRTTLTRQAIGAAVAPDASDVVWILRRGSTRGWLVLDGLGALRLFAATLGLPGPRVARALGAAERGVVTATVASILRAATKEIAISIAPAPDRWHGEGLARVELVMTSSAIEERAFLDLPSDWLPAPPRADLVPALLDRGLEVTFAVELASTTLTARDWSRARPGDAVVFDDRARLDGGGDWSARFVCGAFAAPVTIAPDGRARVGGGFAPTGDDAAHRRGDTADTTKTFALGRQLMSDDHDQIALLNVLASAPIEIVAELGRIVMRADEAAALEAGAVITLGTLRPTAVDLRVGDRTWARGEIVDVDGRLGVRLTSLVHHPGGAPASNDDETLR